MKLRLFILAVMIGLLLGFIVNNLNSGKDQEGDYITYSRHFSVQKTLSLPCQEPHAYFEIDNVHHFPTYFLDSVADADSFQYDFF